MAGWGIDSPAAPVLRYYSVQVGAPVSPEAAESLRSDFEARGFQPVWILSGQTDGRHRVLVGCFDVYVEAEITRDQFRAVGLAPDAWVRVLDGEAPVPRNQGPLMPEALFEMDQRPLPDDPTLRFAETDHPVFREGADVLEPLPDPGDAAVAGDVALLEAIAQNQMTPTQASEVLILAKTRARQRRFTAAKELALPVAQGRVPVSAQDRCEAMLLCARLYHSMDWRATAYRAYQEMLDQAHNPEDRAVMLWEQAALIFELARCERGRFDDTVVAVDRALPQIGDSPEETRMREMLGLLRIQALFWAGGHDDEIVPLARDYIGSLSGNPSFRIETVWALYWESLALERAGRLQEARPLWQRIAEGPVPVDKIRPQIVEKLFVDAIQRQDLAGAEHWSALVDQLEPETHASSLAHGMLQELRQQLRAAHAQPASP